MAASRGRGGTCAWIASACCRAQLRDLWKMLVDSETGHPVRPMRPLEYDRVPIAMHIDSAEVGAREPVASRMAFSFSDGRAFDLAVSGGRVYGVSPAFPDMAWSKELNRCEALGSAKERLMG